MDSDFRGKQARSATSTLAMSSITLGTISLNLTISPASNGLPTRNSVDLQDWISQTAKNAYQSSPRWAPPKLAPPMMGALLSAQGQG
jgi:hypothetical protein